MASRTRLLADDQLRALLRSTTGRWPTNRAILRLTTGAGLRIAELCALDMQDVHLDETRPWLQVRHGKGNKPRRVPLWWDVDSYADLVAYRDWRVERGAAPADPFLVGETGKRLSTQTVRHRWDRMATALGAFGADTSPHWGRHTFGSYALASGRSLAEVRDAMGHASIQTTSIYLHATPDDGTFTRMYGAGKEKQAAPR